MRQDIFVAGLSIGFIKDIPTLHNLLLVNKSWNTVLLSKIYKQILKFCDLKIRKQIWKNLLDTRGFQVLYYKLKSQNLEEFKKSSKSIDDVITLDVLRSFHVYSEEEQESIINVLRCYAMFDSEVEYCQGMNCIAGLLYLIYRDESITFTMFCTLIANLNLSHLYKADVPMLRMYCYQMNRLLAVFLPRLHCHIFTEGINSTFICSSWFITVFTHVLQYCKEPIIPPLLYPIFDGLLTEGYRFIFKTMLFVLWYHEEKMLKMHYDDMVQLVGYLGKSEFFFSEYILKIFHEKIKQFNISPGLLKKLDEEHSNILKMSENFTTVEKQSVIPYKHFLKMGTRIVAVYLRK